MNLYENQYTQLHFERAGLFKAIREKYQCKDVLYPGCSIHITPSLFFPHVVYVDKSDMAMQFFANQKSLLEFVNRNKHYKRSAYIQFIQQDYSQSLPLLERKFDLLLSLFAGGIAKSGAKYLRPGGILLTNNHQSDAWDAAHDNKFKLTAILRFQKGNYSILEEVLDKVKIPVEKLNNKYLKQADQGVKYIENETYYVFECLY